MSRKTLLNIIEGAVLLCLVIFVIAILVSGSSRDIPISEIREMFLSDPGISGMAEKDDKGTDSALGIVPNDYIYFKANEIMDVRELFIARSGDDAELDDISTAVMSHLNTQIDNFTGYGTNQLDLLEHAVYMKKGDYYFFAVGDMADAWQEEFLKKIG